MSNIPLSKGYTNILILFSKLPFKSSYFEDVLVDEKNSNSFKNTLGFA